MADHRSAAERTSEREDHEELQREIEIEHAEHLRVWRALGFADFMAVLMVVVTGFSAYATWRTAQVTSMVFATSDRPFVEVAKVEFEDTHSPAPYVVVNYRNFGRIPARTA